MTDCSVCCTRTRSDRLITCGTCSVSYCKTCQLAQNAIVNTFACLSCKTPFTRVAAQKVRMYPEWKRVTELALLEEEKRKLPDSQPLVEWEREYRRQHARLRFGERMTVRERPQLQESVQSYFACPKEGCRGFVDEHSDACGSCREQVCRMCRELKPSGHVCNPDVLQTISLLQRDSRPCPKCAALIFKIAGCNHMHCTHCNTHFDWNSGEILTVSTNGHYRDSVHARAAQAATRTSPSSDAASAGAGQGGGEMCGEEDSIRRHFVRMPNGSVRRTLWDDYSVVRYTMEKYYNANVIGTKRDNTLMNLRVAYLMNEITEAQWRSRIFSTVKSFDLARAVAFQFGLYVEYVQHFQRVYVRDSHWNPDELCEIISSVNASLALLADEYDSERIAIRLPTDSDDTPALLR